MAEKQHPHSRIAVVSTCPDCGAELGHGEFDRNEVSAREVEQQTQEKEPDRKVDKHRVERMPQRFALEKIFQAIDPIPAGDSRRRPRR